MSAEKNYYLGIDVGATNIKYLCSSVTGESLLEGSILTEKNDYKAFLSQIKSIQAETGSALGAGVSGTGIVIPGFLNFEGRKIHSSPNLKILDGRSIWKDIEAVLETDRFVIDNDANGAAYGEFGFRRMNEPDLKYLVFLTLGSGVGGGMINDGKLLHGCKGYAAELGHIKIFENGRECGCGATGCAEAYIGNNGIVKTFIELNDRTVKKDKLETYSIEDPSAKKIAEWATANYTPAVETMKITGKRLGFLISILINIFNPQIIAIGGGIMNAADLLLPPTLEEARKKTIKCAFDSARIEKALLGAEAGAYGAAALARDVIK